MRINQAEQWIQSAPDNYQAAWHFLAHPDVLTSRDCCTFTPTTQTQLQREKRSTRGCAAISVQALGRKELWRDLTRQYRLTDRHSALKQKVKVLRESIICLWTCKDTIKCILKKWAAEEDDTMSHEYWRTSKWLENAGIIDDKGKPLRERDFPLFLPSTLMKLRVRMESPGVHLLTPPLSTRRFTIRHYGQLRRWCASIFACVPKRVWQVVLEPIRLRKFPILKHPYQWEVLPDRSVIATLPQRPNIPIIRLEQDARSWTWSVSERDHDTDFDDDVQALKFEQRKAGLAFEPTPLLHPTPWSVPTNTRSKKIRQTIRKTRSSKLRQRPHLGIQRILEKMDTGAQQSEWARESQKLHPEQIWQHDGVLTEFQRWTLYRICTRTLNLYHEGWPEDRHCSYQECSTSTETIEHIVWECSRAQEVWQEWLPRWLGHYPHRDEITQLASHFATSKAPLASPDFEKEASRTILYWEAEHDEALQVIWSIWTACTQCTLWIIRNREIFDSEIITRQEAKRRLMKVTDFQTQAVIKGLTARPATHDLGFNVAECYAVFKAIVPSDRPMALRQWTIVIHSTNLSPTPGRRGIWIIIGKAPEEVCWMGFHQEQQLTTGVAMAQRLLKGALHQLKQQELLTTVQLRIQGAKHVLKALKENTETRKALQEMVSTQWRSSHKTANKAIAAIIKSKELSRFTNEVLTRDNVPPLVWKGILDWMPMAMAENVPQDSKSIRHRLQEYQASIGLSERKER